MSSTPTRNDEASYREENIAALTPEEAEIVKAAAARIFPTTNTPGATEAGVVFYIDRTLREAYPRQIATYQEGCAALEHHARARFGAAFCALDPGQQDDALADFDKGTVPGFEGAKEFFALLRKHTMEGLFSEPSYGGNRNMIGWRLVGFPGQQFGYSDPYIDRVIDLEPVARDEAFSPEEVFNGQRH